MREELALIKELPKFMQSENVQQPPASGHEESSTEQNICIKENLSLITNNEIRHSEFNNSIQSNKIIPALNIQDTKVTSLNNIPKDISTHHSSSAKKEMSSFPTEKKMFESKDKSKIATAKEESPFYTRGAKGANQFYKEEEEL